jgi:hypothetical protein
MLIRSHSSPSVPAQLFLLALLGGCGGSSSPGADQGMGDQGQGLPDAGPPEERWEHCPPSSDFVGESSWPITVTATTDAIYCTRVSEGRTLQEELAAKRQLRMVPGTYRLPGAGDTHAFRLPLCVALADGPGPTSTSAAGTLTHTSSVYEGDTYHQLHFEQALTSGSVSGDFSPVQVGSVFPSPVLDGSPVDPFGGNGFTFFFELCASGDCTQGGALYFDSCTHADSTLNEHHVTLEGSAEVHFELRIGQSPASTEPAAFVRAYGEFEGVAFDQRDYFRLVYNPSHHHFERQFAVLFDAPIGGVCGIEVEGLEPWDDYTPDTAYAVDCALERLRALDVVAHTWEREE